MKSETLHIEIRGELLYHWVLVASNGEVLATSETYFSKPNAASSQASELGNQRSVGYEAVSFSDVLVITLQVFGPVIGVNLRLVSR